MKHEQWKAVPGYEGLYQVSDKGHVRSVDRVALYADGRRRPIVGRLLQCGHSGFKCRYAFVQLSKDGKAHNWYIHDLVLLTFVGPKPCGLEACHGPAGHRDNGVDNLYYGTHSRNIRDCERDGTGLHKSIRRSDGKEYPRIGHAARDVGIAASNISQVLNGHRPRAGGYHWEFINA